MYHCRLVVLSLIFSTSIAFKCMEGTVNKSIVAVDCTTFCYSEFAVSEKSSTLLRRGCSRSMNVHEKLMFLVKFQTMPEEKECAETGVTHISPLNRHIRRERICCDYHQCNALRAEMDSNSAIFLLPTLSFIVSILLTV